MIKCAVIPVAGLGKRMLPLSMCVPKEMLPVFSQSDTGIVLKPFLQVILEQLIGYGIQDVCLIVNDNKAAILDYFRTDNWPHNDSHDKRHLSELDNPQVKNLRSLLSKLDITYKKQDEPRGFGDAVLCSRNHVDDFPFLVQAGDELVLSPASLLKLENALSKYSAEAGFLLRHSSNPCEYGVVEGSLINEDTVLVDRITEKPVDPKSNLVVIATYLFEKSIFKALERFSAESPLELTSAINYLINEGHKVVGVKIHDSDIRVETGNVKGYYRSLQRILSLDGRG